MPAKGSRKLFCKRGHLFSEVGRDKDFSCKRCKHERESAWRKANPEMYRSYQRGWDARNRERKNARSRQYRREHPESQQNTHLKNRYGLTIETRAAILTEQGNKCAKTDHDHVTNVLRGQLCHHCNVMLGQAKDNISTLVNAIEYLKKYAVS